MITGKELAEKILQQITEHPGTHFQGAWTLSNDCGTTRCIAGWAVEFNRKGTEAAHQTRERVTQELIEAGVHHPFGDGSPEDDEYHYSEGWEETAAALLGFDRDSACDVFYASEESDAAAKLARHFGLGAPAADTTY